MGLFPFLFFPFLKVNYKDGLDDDEYEDEDVIAVCLDCFAVVEIMVS